LLTVVGIISAAAGAGLATWGMMYRWHGGEQQLALNEAGKAQLDSDVNAVIREYDKNPGSHPRLHAALQKLDSDPMYHPRTESVSAYERLAFDVIAVRDATTTLERQKIAAEIGVATATKQNQLQDTEKKKVETGEAHQRTRSAKVNAEASEELLEKNLPALSRSAQGASRGGLQGG